MSFVGECKLKGMLGPTFPSTCLSDAFVSGEMEGQSEAGDSGAGGAGKEGLGATGGSSSSSDAQGLRCSSVFIYFLTQTLVR